MTPKAFAAILLLPFVLAGCSRNESPSVDTGTSTPAVASTPDPHAAENAERLQKATAKAAEAHRSETAPAASASATASPQ